METILVTDIEVGNTVINMSGDKYKVSKIETQSDGRIAIWDSNGDKRNVCGKKVKYQLCW